MNGSYSSARLPFRHDHFVCTSSMWAETRTGSGFITGQSGFKTKGAAIGGDAQGDH